MVNLKLAELYSILLVICTSLIIFGIFQMQVALEAVINGTKISFIEVISQGIQVAAIGLIISTGILVLFFRKLKKTIELKESKKKAKKPSQAKKSKPATLPKKVK